MLQKKPVILLDMDGIIVNLYKPWLERYNNDYHDNLTVADWRTFSPEGWVKPECGKKFYDYLVADLYLNAPPMLGALETIDRWRAVGAYIKVATALPFHNKPDPDIAGAKFHWLAKYMPWLSFKDVNVVHDKHCIPADVFIDDYDVFLANYKKRWGLAMVCTIDYPHNRTQLRNQHTDLIAEDFSLPDIAWARLGQGVLSAFGLRG